MNSTSSINLVLDHLRLNYGQNPALDLPRLTLDRGATAVLGPNGSGKSTLLRMIATVNQPDAGEIHLSGLAAADDVERTAIRRRLGYVPQIDGLPARMRVHEYLDYVAALKEIGPARLRRRWTRWALDRVDLADNHDAKIKTLSGGMRRRLSIAQGLMGSPDLLVLDEPLTSLDAEYRGEITKLIVGLATTATVVVATHHADELAAVCHRVIVLDAGRLAFDGTPAALASRGANHVWETDTPVEGAVCRAIGPSRYRCVAAQVPPGATIIEPTVGDGYVSVVRYTAPTA